MLKPLVREPESVLDVLDVDLSRVPLAALAELAAELDKASGREAIRRRFMELNHDPDEAVRAVRSLRRALRERLWH